MKYDKDKIAPKVLELLQKGMSLREACKGEGMPAPSTFNLWCNEDSKLAEQYEKIDKQWTRESNKSPNPNKKGSIAINHDDYRRENARKTNSKKFKDNNIYILNIRGTNYYKIGVSNNTHRRYKDIRSSMPFDVDIVFDYATHNAYDFECEIHSYLSEYYIQREWFKLTDAQVEEVIKRAVEWKIDNK